MTQRIVGGFTCIAFFDPCNNWKIRYDKTACKYILHVVAKTILVDIFNRYSSVACCVNWYVCQYNKMNTINAKFINTSAHSIKTTYALNDCFLVFLLSNTPTINIDKPIKTTIDNTIWTLPNILRMFVGVITQPA